MSRFRRPSPTIAGLGLALALVGCGAAAPLAARVASGAAGEVAAAAPAEVEAPTVPGSPAPPATSEGTPAGPADATAAADVDLDAGTGTATTATIAPTTSHPVPSPAPSADEVMRAQRLLLARGTDIGDVDGLVGERTRAGVEAFQAASGLQPTGALDPLTLERLEADSAAVAAQLPASVVVDLSDQHVTVLNAAGVAVATWPVSTGGPGNETPTGTFTVQARQRTGQAEDAPTVHMDWFTVFNGDIGFHGIPWAGDRSNPLWTPLGEAAVSHGCIRMADEHARHLYTFLPDGATVVVQP